MWEFVFAGHTGKLVWRAQALSSAVMGFLYNKKNMKNTFKFLIAICTLLIFPGFVYAWTQDAIPVIEDPNLISALNSINNSINNSTKAILDAQQEAALQRRLNSLDQTCVKEAFNYIDSKDMAVKEYDKAINDSIAKAGALSDPANVAMLNGQLNYLYILRKRQVDFYNQIVIDTCTGYNPPSNDQICKNHYGEKSVWGGKINNTGGPECDCLFGYQWNESSTVCVAKKSNEQICKDYFGINSIWQGQLNAQGGPLCGCASGYQLNGTENSCIIIPVQQSQTVAPAESTLLKPTISSTQDTLTSLPDEEANLYSQNTTTPTQTDDLANKAVNTILEIPGGQTNLVPVQKLKWWQKIWNWFMRR
jgi:hypothetical protein